MRRSPWCRPARRRPPWRRRPCPPRSRRTPGEILNVTAALFNVGDAPHLKLDAVYAPRDPLPADVAQWVLAYVRRLDLEVEVSGYGRGCASVLVI
ncbi:hypothetical protein [Cellulomonas sp. ES6]|uniref:hypothetical protein n=1 Tax=Cellulomonas sp. ES6 TaxID=3039384 RepID=UPI0024B73C00|nr:hypothetical protein [Cellulomonas sp. ES6]WHP18999.1 hypothetical protein P9841_07765 [Cellulomonas sp. ES6]